MNYREMFEYLDKEGYKGHDCETAGLHIHANRTIGNVIDEIQHRGRRNIICLNSD